MEEHAPMAAEILGGGGCCCFVTPPKKKKYLKIKVIFFINNKFNF